MRDDVLGELTEIQDESLLEGYRARIGSADGELELTILLNDSPLAEVLPFAYELAEAIDTHLEVAKRRLVAEFLPLHNSGYLEDGTQPLSQREFLRLAGRPEVSVDIDGEISLTFGHEELLWGHWLSVDISPDSTADTHMSG